MPTRLPGIGEQHTAVNPRCPPGGPQVIGLQRKTPQNGVVQVGWELLLGEQPAMQAEVVGKTGDVSFSAKEAWGEGIRHSDAVRVMVT
jgi:hypothetical protein